MGRFDKYLEGLNKNPQEDNNEEQNEPLKKIIAKLSQEREDFEKDKEKFQNKLKETQDSMYEKYLASANEQIENLNNLIEAIKNIPKIFESETPNIELVKNDFLDIKEFEVYQEALKQGISRLTKEQRDNIIDYLNKTDNEIYDELNNAKELPHEIKTTKQELHNKMIFLIQTFSSVVEQLKNNN